MLLKVASEPTPAPTQYLNVILPAGEKKNQAAEAA